VNYFSIKHQNFSIINTIDCNVIDLIRNKRKFARNYLKALKEISTIKLKFKQVNKEECNLKSLCPISSNNESISEARIISLNSKLKNLETQFANSIEYHSVANAHTKHKQVASFSKLSKNDSVLLYPKFISLDKTNAKYNISSEENVNNIVRKTNFLKSIANFKSLAFLNLKKSNVQGIKDKKTLESVMR